MARVENKNAPSFDGWLIAAGIAIVAGGVAYVVGDFRNEIVGFIAALVFVVAAAFLVLPWGGGPAPRRTVPLPATAKPAGEPVAPQPAAFVAVPEVAAAAAGPLRLDAPRDGRADDLTEIEGIGPAMARLCNSLGFWHFDQIAAWTDADVAWVDGHMGSFKGRITRDKWVAQARLIVSEGLEAFRIRAKANDY